MLVCSEEGLDRANSLGTQNYLAENDEYEGVDHNKLYQSVLKILILEYCNEVRFRTPIVQERPEGNGSSAFSSSPKKHNRNKSEQVETRLPPQLTVNLRNHLNMVAMKKVDQNLDPLTRRSLLRLYGEMLDPFFKAEKPEFLMMKFVSGANKEMLKLEDVSKEHINTIVFKQTQIFVGMLIKLMQKEKNNGSVIAKLREYVDTLNPEDSGFKSSSASSSNPLHYGPEAKYVQPSFRTSDMDQASIDLIAELFNVDKVKIQQDIFKFKDSCQAKCLHRDIEQLLLYLKKDLGQYTRSSFENEEAYQQWKSREESSCQYLLNKYKIPDHSRLLPVPPLASGETFHILPLSSNVKSYFVSLIKLCLENEKAHKNKLKPAEDGVFLSKNVTNLLKQCAIMWRVDYPARAVTLYTASCQANMLVDIPHDRKFKRKDIYPVNVDQISLMFAACRQVVERGNLSWIDKKLWPFVERSQWVKNLSYSYSCTMLAIRDSLSNILSESSKPKFAPYLAVLGKHLESDELWSDVEESLLPQKWESKLLRTVVRLAQSRYAEILRKIPRDDSVTIKHVLQVCDNIIDDVKFLQKKYKSRLLGFLEVSRTFASVVTDKFANDSKSIIKHIKNNNKQRGEFLPYADMMETYKALSEIRFIHNRISSNTFAFDLEEYFFPYLLNWIEETKEKLIGIIQQAIASDSLKPIDLNQDTKKHSSSIIDIFAMIKNFINIIKEINWQNEFQLAMAYLVFMSGVSNAAIRYSEIMEEKIVRELVEEDNCLDEKEGDKENDDASRAKNWIDEMRTVVSTIHYGSKLKLEQPYNFKPGLCVALNNIAEMVLYLERLEYLVDPEHISNMLTEYDPNFTDRCNNHVFTIKVKDAENLKSQGYTNSLYPYVTLIDTKTKKMVGRTRTVVTDYSPCWDEEFELSVSANSTLSASLTVWDERYGTHSICGRALLKIDPKRYQHDGFPNEVFLDLDSGGKLFLEFSVENERNDPIFFMGRAHRSLKRCLERSIKLIVEKFSKFIHQCFSRQNLKSVSGNNGNLHPTQDQIFEAMIQLCDYLNLNFQVLAEYLTKQLLMNVMLAAWSVIVSSADELALPKLTSADAISKLPLSANRTSIAENGGRSWLSAVNFAKDVTYTISYSGFERALTGNEVEILLSWLHFLCIDFFHNRGNGPSVDSLKNEQYQSLLLMPVYYDRDADFLKHEVDLLAPSYISFLKNKYSFDNSTSSQNPKKARIGTILRNNSILLNATRNSRARAAKELKEVRADPIMSDMMNEDIILRLLLVKGEKTFVVQRMEEREKASSRIKTEQLAIAIAEGKFSN